MYPDNGQQFEDASILRNAVYFSTAFRYHSAETILQRTIGLGRAEMAFSVLEAFSEFMTATEDLIGWLFALEKWEPGTADQSLFLLLDRIQVGRNNAKEDFTEQRAADLLNKASPDEFRQLVHIPSESELKSEGIDQQEIEVIRNGVDRKLDGWRNVIDFRLREDRGWVRAFNKIKHHAFVFPLDGATALWMPTRITLRRAANEISLSSATQTVSIEEIRTHASRAIQSQAVLHDTLASLLVYRYGHTYEPPGWVMNAYRNRFD